MKLLPPLNFFLISQVKEEKKGMMNRLIIKIDCNCEYTFDVRYENAILQKKIDILRSA